MGDATRSEAATSEAPGPAPATDSPTASEMATRVTAPVEPGVTDLRLVAVAPGRSHLVLEGSDNRQFRVPVDERLAAALRTPDRSRNARDGQLEITVQSQLSPREIQARVRAGHSVEAVAAAAGITAERIERYAVPVLAERAHVVEQARKAPARRATAGSAPVLGDVVDARLAEQKVALDSATWDAWRGEDERWTVSLDYLAAGRSRTASWSFDPRGRVLAAADDEARWLVEGSGSERGELDLAPAVRRLAAVPEDSTPVPPSTPRRGADEVYDHQSDRAPAGPAAPAPSSGARGRRQPVPSWDDIMFGPRKR